MTTREFYLNVISANVNDELTAHAQEALAKLDAANEKKREASAKKNAEKEAQRAPLREAIISCLTVEPKTATVLIAEAGLEIKPQSMPSLMKPLVELGTVVKREVKVTGKGKQVGYALAE